MKIIYETGWNNAEFPEELSYEDPTGCHQGQYVVTPLYAFELDELEKFWNEAFGNGSDYQIGGINYVTSFKEFMKQKGWVK